MCLGCMRRRIEKETNHEQMGNHNSDSVCRNGGHGCRGDFGENEVWEYLKMILMRLDGENEDQDLIEKKNLKEK